ncbi:CCA tRNA nucleotidyltransferase [Acidicapsa dinghuensis]|uniref:CCA tRNA nucleotidyltransferase n=1 Tax=Acidicapsa dinghuensis TaxID=2218256 RepID=A0ABW1EAU7_9BACT|nr:CCA tRNA nucleotidyltransferase [Acidicapsa dinghuensis]
MAARAIVARLRAEGHQAYLAGGCVRDLLLGPNPKDYDVATSATPDIVLNLFPRTFAVGAHFGVVIVADEVDAHYVQTEVATFRSDGAYSDGRHPDAVRYTLSAEEDIQRRDFTINGLLLDPEALSLNPHESPNTISASDEAPHTSHSHSPLSGVPGLELETWDQLKLRPHVLDFVGGLADLNSGILRAIGLPLRRFEEDRLRMLRAIRFAARFGYAIEPATFAAIQSLAPRIASVSRERIREELTRMLTEGHARRAFELLDTSGLLIHVLPEAAKLKGVEQPPQFHPEGDVWTHTLMLLEQLEAGSPMTLAWGALLHDIGKPATFQPPTTPNDRIRFNGHVEVGVAIGADICRRMRFSNEETTQILALIENHMRFGDVHRMKAATLKRFFRLDRFPEHLALHRMDCNASHGSLDNYHFAREQYKAIPEEEVRPTPLLTGRDLIALGYHPGPTFKTILHTIEEAQLEGAIQTTEEALALAKQQFPLTPDL